MTSDPHDPLRAFAGAGPQIPQRPCVDRGEADEHEACVADRAVGQHALDIGLADGHDCAERKRGERQPDEDRRPGSALLRDRHVQHTRQRSEASCLGDRRQVAGDRARRTLVHIGRPEVERDGGHLEAEPDQQQRYADEQQVIGFPDGSEEEVADPAEVRAARRAVHQCDAVEKEGRAKGAEHEVLHGRLAGGIPPPCQRDQHVQRNRQRFEP